MAQEMSKLRQREQSLSAQNQIMQAKIAQGGQLATQTEDHQMLLDIHATQAEIQSNLFTDFQDASSHPYTTTAADTRPYSTTDLYTQQYPPYQPVTTTADTHAFTDPRKQEITTTTKRSKKQSSLEELSNDEDQLVNEIDSFLIEDDDI